MRLFALFATCSVAAMVIGCGSEDIQCFQGPDGRLKTMDGSGNVKPATAWTRTKDGRHCVTPNGSGEPIRILFNEKGPGTVLQQKKKEEPPYTFRVVPRVSDNEAETESVLDKENLGDTKSLEHGLSLGPKKQIYYGLRLSDGSLRVWNGQDSVDLKDFPAGDAQGHMLLRLRGQGERRLKIVPLKEFLEITGSPLGQKAPLPGMSPDG